MWHVFQCSRVIITHLSSILQHNNTHPRYTLLSWRYFLLVMSPWSRMIFLTCSGGMSSFWASTNPNFLFSLYLFVCNCCHFLATIIVHQIIRVALITSKLPYLSLAYALLLLEEDQELAPVASPIEERPSRRSLISVEHEVWKRYQYVLIIVTCYRVSITQLIPRYYPRGKSSLSSITSLTSKTKCWLSFSALYMWKRYILYNMWIALEFVELFQWWYWIVPYCRYYWH